MSSRPPASIIDPAARRAEASTVCTADGDPLVRQLSGWLGATDIGWLELRGPGVHVRLRNDAGRVEPMPTDLPFDEATSRQALAGAATMAGTWAVAAPSVGVCLHAHPLREQPLVAPGQAVAAGDIVALLQVGALLMPVTAPRAGVVVRHAVAAGTRVGYGTALVHLR